MFRTDDVTAVLLPGVPSECRYLTETALLPWLRRQSSGTILSHDLRIFGLSEPQVQELLGDLMDQAVNPSLAPYAKTGEVMLRLTAKGDSPAACEECMAPLLEQCHAVGLELYLVSNASRRQPEYWPRVPGSQLFGGTVISACHRCVKPQAAIYRIALEQFRLRPEECLFNDDMEQNIQGARAVGIPGFLFTGDAAALGRCLREQGVPLP